MIPRAKVYQVGELQYIKPDDRCFDNWKDALAHARELEVDMAEIVGIWSSQDEGGSLLAVVIDREVFVRWG